MARLEPVRPPPRMLVPFLLTTLATLATLWVLLVASGLPWPAVAPVRDFVLSLARSRSGRLGSALVLGILIVNMIETSVDPGIASTLGLEFTRLVHRLEGNLVGLVQDLLLGHRLVSFWAWVYVFLYPALLLAPLFVFHAQGRPDRVRAYVGAFLFNYLFAIPFYLFCPVTETGVSGLGGAVPLLEGIWPGFMDLLRSSSAPDNCFPSLHTSCSFTVFFFALRHGGGRFTRIAGACAVLVMASTWALGIHWISDAVAGLGLALLAARLGPVLAERWETWLERGAEPVVARPFRD